MEMRSIAVRARCSGRAHSFVRSSARGLIVLLVALGLATLPALAHATPPDPSWLAGVWDAGDSDDVIVLVCSAIEAISPPVLADDGFASRPIGVIRPQRDRAIRAPLRAAVHSRAPPAV